MKSAVAGEITSLLKKHFEIRKLWMYDQFNQVYEKNILMQGIDLEDRFIDFLTSEGVQEILFFPEPGFDTENVGARILTTEEVSDFICKHAAIWTNNHIASPDLAWIFTLSHVGDYLLSGPVGFAKKALDFLKEAGAKKKSAVD